jgi:hypothetical protein
MQENQNVDTQLQDAFSAFQNGRAGAQSAGEPETDQQSEDPSTQEKQGNGNEPNETQQTPDPSEKTNQAFAKMRTENSQLQKRQQDIEAVVKTMGYESIDDFLVKKAEEQLQQQAQKNQIPVGVEKRIQDLEKENERYRQHEQQERFGREVSNLVAKYNIDKASFDNFTAQLIANRINPMVTGVPLETYFIQFNPDFVYQQRLAEEKKKWEAELNKDKNAPITTPNGSLVPNPNETKSDPSKKTVDWKALAAKYAK